MTRIIYLFFCRNIYNDINKEDATFYLAYIIMYNCVRRRDNKIRVIPVTFKASGIAMVALSLLI